MHVAHHLHGAASTPRRLKSSRLASSGHSCTVSVTIHDAFVTTHAKAVACYTPPATFTLSLERALSDLRCRTIAEPVESA